MSCLRWCSVIIVLFVLLSMFCMCVSVLIVLLCVWCDVSDVKNLSV